MSRSNGATLMTDGSIWKRITLFAIPLIWGNLFQQLYNTADSLIVGNYLGSNALASVSSSSNLIYLMVGFFNGVAVGAGVVVAHYFGAQDFKNLRKIIHSTVGFGLFCGILLTIIGVFGAPQLLIWMETPEEILPGSIIYFRIYFAGSLAFAMYNFFVGILQAIGDSRHPLIYLIISSITNVILDIFFIGVLGFGVGSAALATVISQFLSAVLCLIQLLRSPEEFRLHPKEICIDPGMLREIIHNGLPSGLQNSIIAIGNVFVQSQINSFGAYAIAGVGTYGKIQGFVFIPIFCFSQALTTFVSQNLGAKEYERAKKGSRFGMAASMVLAELIGIVIFLFIPTLIRAFDTNPQVIAAGTNMARVDTLFYFLLAISHCMAAIMRGAGKPKVPMFVMMFCWCITRVIFISICMQFTHNIYFIYWAYPITWIFSTIVFTIYYKKTDWVHGLEY